MIAFLPPIAAALAALLVAYLALRALIGTARRAPMLVVFVALVAGVIMASR